MRGGTPFDFRDVLLATEARGETTSRLTELVETRDWVMRLVRWLGLEKGDTPPTRRQIVGRLTLEIAAIDRLACAQLDAVIHDPKLQELEASWRGLAGLHKATLKLPGDLAKTVKIRLLDMSWSELTRDISRATEFDQSKTFQLVYSDEFDQPGGTPYGVLIGDYYVTHERSKAHKDDIGTLRGMAQIAAAAFCPFITGAHASLLGIDEFRALERPIHFGRTFGGVEYTAWNSLRRLADARFLGLTLPRTLMRERHSDHPIREDGFLYQETIAASTLPDGTTRSAESKLLWGNAAFAFGEVLIVAFAENGWLAAIRGAGRDEEGRGLVTEVTHEWHPPELKGTVSKGSLEINLTSGHEGSFGEFGFIPLVHCHGTRYPAFYGNQSLQDWRVALPDGVRSPGAEANAKLSSMLQYIFCVSRFSHYVKVMARQKVGSYASANELQSMLSNWLIKYATANAQATAEAQARFPLRDARVEVREKPANPGVYTCKVHLQPHYQMDQLATSISISTDVYTGYDM